MDEIQVSPGAWQAMVDAATQSYPEEACGALFGRPEGQTFDIVSAKRLQNVSKENRQSRYEAQIAEVAAAEREAQAQGDSLVAVFHSHPDSPAEPSGLDLDLACPWYISVILSVRQGVVDEVRAFRLDPEDQSAAELSVIRPAASKLEGLHE